MAHIHWFTPPVPAGPGHPSQVSHVDARSLALGQAATRPGHPSQVSHMDFRGSALARLKLGLSIPARNPTWLPGVQSLSLYHQNLP